MVGLPGTGLGGLFYALLILWIILREGWYTLCGAGRLARWRSIAHFAFLLALILVALSAQAGVIAWFMDSHAFQKLVDGNATPADLLTPGLTIGSLFVLIAIFAGLQFLRLRLAYAKRHAEEPSGAIAPTARQMAAHA
ncbi:hypothetical protein IC614_01125 [Allosphingosinicella flava]|uniref:Uncharacterized protein n=1 Tax=Allosphingosinicella flava TaxID=2771430 RepID=A0A7T2GK05_9SPHN|nr:hypothetical protein [Sphingosinicella flava]QPQ55251.1 hypothetical protein IC614_01125 [Sphingosinicella flava]